MKTILVLTDFSQRSEHAAEFAWQLAIKEKADILFYNSYQFVPPVNTLYGVTMPISPNNYSDLKRQSMEKLIALSDRLIQKFQDSEDDFVPAYRCNNGLGELGDNVEKVLVQEDVWMIVMADKRDEGSFVELLLGSDVERVISKSNCPILLIPEKVDFFAIKRISLALEKVEPIDVKALNFMVQFAEPFGAEIVATHVSPKMAIASEVNELLEDFYYKGAGIAYEKVGFYNIQGDDVPQALVNFESTMNLDMIALINRKHNLFEQLFHQGTTQKMMNYHTIPLLVFPPAYS